MWMMGYNEGGDLRFGSDSFDNGRKLRPLIPRPIISSSSSSPPLNLIHTNDFFSQFHHMAAATLMVVSSRWNPTPEQLRLLEELYRRGTRTPSADQIQHITAQLRRFGKIEGKNVFYWFQNHKARERQKRRRQMESDDHSARDIDILQTKDSGSGRTTVYEVEHTKNWAPSTNCSTLVEESVAIQRAEKVSVMEGRDLRTENNGWLQFEELHHQQIRRNNNNNNNNNFGDQIKNGNNIIINPASLQLMHCSMSNALIGSGGGDDDGQVMIMMNTDPPMMSTTTTSAKVTTKMHQIKCHNNNEEEECEESAETLQLFPLCSETKNGGCETLQTSSMIMMNTNHLTPLHFFEFLPLKNSTN